MVRMDKDKETEQKNEAFRKNAKLNQELAELQNKIQENAVELRNESRRHDLLTKEFNSLLEENGRLKVQLRRRIHTQEAYESKKQAQTSQAIPVDNKEPVSVLSKSKASTMSAHPYPPFTLTQQSRQARGRGIRMNEPFSLTRANSTVAHLPTKNLTRKNTSLPSDDETFPNLYDPEAGKKL